MPWLLRVVVSLVVKMVSSLWWHALISVVISHMLKMCSKYVIGKTQSSLYFCRWNCSWMWIKSFDSERWTVLFKWTI